MTLAAIASLWMGTTMAATELSRPAVIELYTSEGCSSCPPADALLEELSRRPDVIAIALHVDYWDGLGWRDRFALPIATERQRDFGRRLKLGTIGTPQMIVDGRASVFGVDRAAVERALSQPRLAVPLAVSVEQGLLSIEAPPLDSHSEADVYLIPYLSKATTAIQRGENAGRTLVEVNVARSVKRIGTADGKTRQWRVALSSLPTDATRVLVMLQRHADGVIVGAQSLEVTR